MAVPPRRIVSLVPSLTETVCDLGVAARLVAATRFCCWPAEALRFVPRVGGTKDPDLEQIARLSPDLVLVNGEENRSEDIDWLGSRFELFETLPRTVPDAAIVVQQLGRQLGLEQEAEAITLEVEVQIARAQVLGLGRAPLRVFYPIWREPWIATNRHTYVHDVLTRAGAINVTADRDARYPIVAKSELRSLDVDLVLLPSEPFAFSDQHRRRLLADGTFGSDVPILLVDGRSFCWHGSRSGRGLATAVNLLRPFRRMAG